MAREWVLGMRSNVAFTPDSRALIICRDDEISFWDVGTAELIRRLRRDVAHYPGDVIFSPDGKLMALELAPAVINLMEVATGRTVAKLEDPHGDRPRWKCFTPDGTQLVVVALHARAIHVWDPPAEPVSKTAPPPNVEVRLGDLAQFALSREEKARQAIEQYSRAVDANPDDAMACNNLAWFYATVPESLRDVNAAVLLAEKAVRLDPASATFGNTLGVAYYRAGRYREAVEVLRANLDRQKDAVLAFDLYFLAMSHHRLGDHARARAYYDWAARWSRTHKGRSPGDVEELDIFRAEASELLGVAVKDGVEIGPPPRVKQ
jgi:tetratricopeptide (TPR) repeat protein